MTQRYTVVHQCGVRRALQYPGVPREEWLRVDGLGQWVGSEVCASAVHDLAHALLAAFSDEPAAKPNRPSPAGVGPVVGICDG